MKKTKIITISLLGLLLLVPFMRPSRAQVPSYVGVAVGEHYEWDQNVYVGALFDTWNQWWADNMTYHWAIPFGQTDWDNMTTVYDSSAWDPTPPQLRYYVDIDLILADTWGVDANYDGVINTTESFAYPGRTLVNTSGGNIVPDYPLYDYLYPLTISIGNDTAKFAEDCWYGAAATSAFWTVNYGGFYTTNTILFAPTNVNWTEFVDLCNTGLEAWYGISFYGYTLTVTELANGYMISSPVMGFGNNSQTINITTTYDSMGVMNYQSFEYGSNLLYDYVLVDLEDPVITAASSDFSVDHDYTGVTINWTATDATPDRYGITRNGSTVVSPTTPWTSGVEVQYAVPVGLTPGDYLFKITFVDEGSNLVSDEVTMTVNPAPAEPPGIPGFELYFVIGVFTVATIGIIIRMKKKK